MSRPILEPLSAGRQAIDRHAWREGFDLLVQADASEKLTPEDLESLAEAAWWTGRLDECIEARQRAYAALSASGEPLRAAMVALALAKDYYAKRASAVGTAWLNRAQRILAQQPESVEHGYLERTRAVVAFEGMREFDTALDHASRALDIGTRFGDRELMALALHDQGRILIAKGQVPEGLALMDEATVAAVGGELGPYWTAAIYCNMISACRDLADYGRAGEWSEAAKRWCERQAISGFPGMCRVYRAEIMRLRGAWREAELEARLASEELQEFNLNYAAAAFYEMGEIRLRVGDLAGAEHAIGQAHELGHESEPGLSMLRLAQGKIEAAVASIARALAEHTADPLARARLLPAQVEIAISAGDLATGRGAAEELVAIGKGFRSAGIEAAGFSALGAVRLAEGDAAGALTSLRQACGLWREIDAPYEGARARMHMARAHRALGDEESAVLDLRAALSAFESLGARPDAKQAAELLGGASFGRGAKRVGQTLMITDIVKSTPLVEAIGDEAWEDLIRWHDQTLRSLFTSHRGQEIDHAGDGFFVSFEDATTAIDCAVAVQRTLADHRTAHGFSPQVRIGLHRAEVLRTGGAVRGKGVHEAARIASIAEGGQILASHAVLEAGSSRFLASEPRSVRLKGTSEPVQVSTIEWR
ncbi:MAG TPA: adenylate/guanylate cyclase domain-containing protein [Actinomycetota bacterium]